MSGFHELGDAFAGDEANDEWDATWAAYAAGDEPFTDADRLPLRAVLDLPIGKVEIRGDDPGIEFCLLPSHEEGGGESPSQSEFDDSSVHSPALTLSIQTGDTGRISYRVLDGRGDEIRSGELEDHESASELLDRLVDLSVDVDGIHVYLNAACVEVEERGVLIVSTDVSARDMATKGLISNRARYLTDSLVAAHPGTHPIGGLKRRRAGAEESRTVESASIDAIFLVDDGAERLAGIDALPVEVDRVQAVVDLAQFIHPGSRNNPMSCARVATLAGGATCHRIHPGDVAELADVIPRLRKESRRLVVVSELSGTQDLPGMADTDGRSSVDGSGSTGGPTPTDASSPSGHLLLRFDDGALLSDSSASPVAIEADALGAVEQRMVADHRRKLVPAAFGLPGCPIGTAAGDLWKAQNVDDLPPSLPTGVAAELISRELLGADDEAKERIIGAHIAARSRGTAVASLLEEVLGATEHIAVRPVVLGELVDSLDGLLPSHFTDVKNLDLLVPVDFVDAFVAALEPIGLVHETVTLTTASLESGLSVVLSRAGEDPINVEIYRTLASGPFGVLVDPREFHGTAVPIRVGTSWCNALHPAHRFIHACVRFDSASRNDMGLARSLIQNSPRTSALGFEMLDMAERWGATATVLSVVAELDKLLAGMPAYLASVATGRTDRSKRTRRIGRRA
ncbi:MAG: hypothetical protein WBA45_13920 [Microthrixaceae bacterium]